MQEFLNESEHVYEEASNIGGFTLNAVGRGHMLLKYCGLDQARKDHVLLLCNYDLGQYDQIKGHLEKIAKPHSPSQLPVRKAIRQMPGTGTSQSGMVPGVGRTMVPGIGKSRTTKMTGAVRTGMMVATGKNHGLMTHGTKIGMMGPGTGKSLIGMTDPGMSHPGTMHLPVLLLPQLPVLPLLLPHSPP